MNTSRTPKGLLPTVFILFVLFFLLFLYWAWFLYPQSQASQKPSVNHVIEQASPCTVVRADGSLVCKETMLDASQAQVDTWATAQAKGA